MGEDKKSFEYTYSVPTERERKEIESIRRGYEEKTAEQSDFERLRALDHKAKMLPKTLAVLLGVVSVLVFGLGMSIVMVWAKTVLGVIICSAGAVGMAVNYPIFKKLTRFAKRKYGSEIIKLSDKIFEDYKKS